MQARARDWRTSIYIIPGWRIRPTSSVPHLLRYRWVAEGLEEGHTEVLSPLASWAKSRTVISAGSAAVDAVRTMRKEFVLPRVFNPGAPNQDLVSRLLVGYVSLRLGTQRPIITIRQKVSFVILNILSDFS